VRGLQHRFAVEPRQDAFGLQVARREAGIEELIAVVCDGAGSLPRSHEAAALAARRLAELGRDGRKWTDAFATVSAELCELATSEDGEDSSQPSMATTALAVRLRCDQAGWYGDVGRVGDSGLWHLAVDGRWSQCTARDDDVASEAFHTSRSVVLPAVDMHVDEHILEFYDGALFLMSDGVANPLAWAGEVQTNLARWWATAPNIYNFGADVGFVRKSHMDDRTVVGLWIR
jgi:hypothetical protein